MVSKTDWTESEALPGTDSAPNPQVEATADITDSATDKPADQATQTEPEGRAEASEKMGNASGIKPAVPHPTSPFAPSRAKNRTRPGVRTTPGGLDVVVCAPHATAVEFCIFESTDPHAPEQRYRLHGPFQGLWHGHFPGLGVGTVYGFRAWGPWLPEAGHRYNPHKLLADPYARALSGNVDFCGAVHSHLTDDDLYPAFYPMRMDTQDSAPYTVRSVVVSKAFDVAAGPEIPWSQTVVYEFHVKGFTKNMPGVPEELQGTYAGLAHPATIAYLRDLGVTTIELLPIHFKVDEPFLTERGLTNYWGYSTLGYFAPNPSYATEKSQAAGPQAVIDEFRGMVSILHQAGLEVVLDVVYNHTCEGGSAGQSLSFRGLDNRMYYVHDSNQPTQMLDYTGCGNSLDFSEPRVVQLALDSLRYWADEVGVDGFRFDLGVTLGRFGDNFTPDHPFLVALGTDPILSTKKLIMEPWDVGPGGWRTGDFPLPLADWNDRFRDTVRSFWLSDASLLARGQGHVHGPHELATRLSGSADMFSRGSMSRRRAPYSSVNFVTAHDGFTMMDLVSYEHKHNEANLEDNRDGTTNNRSWNHGMEGNIGGDLDLTLAETASDPLSDVLPMRLRSIRNMMAMMLVAAGTPMLVAGDEMARTQHGNNNAYCQDNDISWLSWQWNRSARCIHSAVRHLLYLRRQYPVMRPEVFSSGHVLPGDMIADLSWWDRKGFEFTPEGWHKADARVLQMLRSGHPFGDRDLLVVMNATLEPAKLRLAVGRGKPYELVWDSTWDEVLDPNAGLPGIGKPGVKTFAPGARFNMEALSVAILLA